MGLGLIAVRVAVFAARRASVGAPRVLIIGTGAEAKGVAADLQMPGRARRSVVGFFAAGGEADSVAGARVFEQDTPIDRIVSQFGVDEVIVAVREQRGGGVPWTSCWLAASAGIPVLDLAGFYERAEAKCPSTASRPAGSSTATASCRAWPARSSNAPSTSSAPRCCS